MEVRISFFVNGSKDFHVAITANCETWDEVNRLIEAVKQTYLKHKTTTEKNGRHRWTSDNTFFLVGWTNMDSDVSAQQETREFLPYWAKELLKMVDKIKREGKKGLIRGRPKT